MTKIQLINNSLFNRIVRSEDEIIEIFKSALSKKNNINLTYINQHCFNIYCSSLKYRDYITNHFTCYLDGVGMYYALKILGYKKVEKYNASEVNTRIFELLSASQKKVFIIGGRFEEDIIVSSCTSKKVNLVGYHHGYIESTEIEKLLLQVKQKEPDVIIIGVGVPKQEFIANEISKHLICDCIVCVGNFLEFYFETIKRAPKFLRNSGLEWIFRLMTEPRRLWKRYLFGIPLFIFRIIKLKLRNLL
jgi:N-acetylglucosaminyldiphosphoundecaprenol N-acetyl-beta-D-mannosaminyltransferase